jgi:rRNA-processing protein FCF1
MQKWAQIGLGGASLLTGILQTFMNKLGYAKNMEAHRVAGVSWGKFNRQLCIEMNLHPDERMDSANFLKMFRVELDRLIEQSPPIPENVIKEFNELFKNTSDVVKPEITGILQHTKVYKDTNSRLKRIAAEATVNLHYKRGVIKQMVIEDLEKKTRKVALEETRKLVTDMFEQQKAMNAAGTAAAASARKRGVDFTPSATITEKLKQERTTELKNVAAARAGAVAELRGRFKTDSESSNRIVTFANATSGKTWAETRLKQGETAEVPSSHAKEPPVPPIVVMEPSAPPSRTEVVPTIDTIVTINDSGFHTPGLVEESSDREESASNDRTKP